MKGIRSMRSSVLQPYHARVENPATQPLIAQGLACSRCKYCLEGLPDLGESAQCPECGHIGAPIWPRPFWPSVIRGMLIASTAFSSGLILWAAGVGAWLAFQADWSLREACESSLVYALIGIAAGFTGCVAVFAHGKHGHLLRLAGIVVQLALFAYAMFRWHARFQSFTDFRPPAETLVLLAYATLAIATLTRHADARRLRALFSNLKIRGVAGAAASVIAVTVIVYGAVYALRALPQLGAARKLASSGAGVSWDGPRVVAVFAKGLPLSDLDLALLESLPHVESLYLSETGITDEGVVHVAALSNLQYLYLDGTSVSDSGIELLRGHTALRSLWLSDTDITDSAMPAIATLTGLNDLYLGGTNISDDGLALLRNLPDLKYVNAPGTKVSPKGAADLEGRTDGLKVWAGKP